MGYGRLTIHRVQQHLTYGKKEEKAYKRGRNGRLFCSIITRTEQGRRIDMIKLTESQPIFPSVSSS